MNAFTIRDPALVGVGVAMQPGRLTGLLAAALSRQTQGLYTISSARIVRFRHRPGQRAILQLELRIEGVGGRCRCPGALWYFRGGKVQKALGALSAPVTSAPPPMFLEPVTGGLVCLFPYDRRAPLIADFLERCDEHAPILLGVPPETPPELVRYRPGIGATFRWRGLGRTVYVKVHAEDSPVRLYRQNHALCRLLRDSPASVPDPIGAVEPAGAFSQAEADGEPLDALLRQSGSSPPANTMGRVAAALAAFHNAPLKPSRSRNRNGFIARAHRTAGQVGLASPALGQVAEAISEELAATPCPLHLSPSHMDMKAEHIFLGGNGATFVDLDSMAFSDPLYDLGMLDLRLSALSETGACAPALISACRAALLSAYAPDTGEDAAPRFRWLRAAAALQLAKHFVQNLGADWELRAARVLADAWNAPRFGHA